MVEGKYQVSYANLPTNGGIDQSIVLIENGGKYGFASCPSNGEYGCANKEQIERMKRQMLESDVKPIVISKGKEKFLVDRIISHVNSQENLGLLGEESKSISKLLEMIPK